MSAVNMARTPTAPRYSFYTIVAFTLLALALLRATLLVIHTPVLGYGDHGDIHRTADCIGLKPIESTARPAEFPRPHAEYHTGGVKWSGCYPGTAVVLATPVVLAYGLAFLASDDAEILIPLQAFGVFNLALFALLSLVTAFALRKYPVASVVHAAILFFIIADPVVTLWLNTLHTEPGALLGAYGAIAMSAVIVLTGGRERRYWWLLGASLIALGFAREQFAYLPLALSAIAWPALRRRAPRKAWTMVAISAAVAVAQVALGPLRPDYVSPMNRVNAYLGVILSSSTDEARTLEALDLPPSCAILSGSSWRQQRGEGLEATCPEARALSSFAFLRLVPTEPFTLLRAVSRILPAAEAIAPGYLGISSEGQIRSVFDLPARVMSFVALLSSINAMVYSMVVMTMLISFPLALGWLIWTVRREPIELAALPLLFTSLIAIAGYSLATTAFGDGIVGAERHYWLGSLAMLAAVALLPLVIWQLSRDLLGGRIALAAVFGAVLLGCGWLLWTRDQPMAIGALERMARGPGGRLEVGGWALDPWGVRRVFVSVGGGPQTEGMRGIERRDLEAIYPGYPEGVSGGFQITVAPNAWRENERLRVYVENRAGAVTEIDRRLIRVR